MTGDRVPADDGSPTFAFRGVSVTLGSTAALRSIDLEVPASGVTVVLGPSGSGKSTLTRLCNRLIDPDEGEVLVRGADIRSLDVLALRRAVGMVFQRPALFDGTVRDNLAATGVTDPGRFDAILGDVGLERAFLDRRADTLSGGEAQRLCLARTLLTEPMVLVADEPTSSLDEASARTLEDRATTLASRGVPILWVTHDLAQYDRLADHGVVLEQGRIARAGPVARIRSTGRLGPAAGDAP